MLFLIAICLEKLQFPITWDRLNIQECFRFETAAEIKHFSKEN